MHDFYNLRYYGKETIELTYTENIILDLLLRNKKHIVKYEELTKILYQKKANNKRNCLKASISKLNIKLKNEFKIYNKVNIGYVIF